MSNFEEVIKKIKILRYEKILLETKLSNITFIQSPSFNERIAGGLKKDIEEKYAEYSELLRKIKKTEHELNRIEQDFNKLVDNLANIDDILILKLYYIEGLNLFKISKKLNYNYGYVRQRKQKSIKKLKNL